MDGVVTIRAARPGDADSAADLAEVKRAEYERYSPVFWRRAKDARAQHLPFLRSCIASDEFAAFTAENGSGEIVGIILANRRGAPPPFHADLDPTWFVDDFFVAQADHWQSVGQALLTRVADAARADGAARLLVVGAQRDTPKRDFLLGAGYSLAAAWWVHPVTPTEGPAPELDGIAAVVTPAPPVYDPGGPVALALSLGDTPATRVARFDEWAAAAQATLAIVPARSADTPLAAALTAQGYEVASEWFIRPLASPRRA